MASLFSRYYNVDQVTDEDTIPARLYLGYRFPVGYRERADNAVYVVRSGDTLDSVAYQHYAALGTDPNFSAARLYWIVADYQPSPMLDPTVQLRPGQRLILPSIEFVRTEIFG